MKRALLLLLLLVLCVPVLSPVASGQDKGGKQTFIVGFYNLENLFDTYDDPVKNDNDFLPTGSYQWTEVKYNKKLHNMATVIAAMAETNGRFHTLLGVSEIENRLVLEDLVSQPELADAHFEIVHYDSPDRRGVDVGLLYDPSYFTYLDSESIPYTFDSPDITFDMDEAAQQRFRTRDILMVHGTIAGEEIAAYVAHLPSRVGGKGGDLRSRGAEIIYDHAMKMMEAHPGIKVIVMGDMNDNPDDESMTTYIHGKEHRDDVGPADFFNPFLSMYHAGFGTLAYQGVWNLFDNIFVNYDLLNGPEGTLHIRPSTKKGFYGVTFRKPWMLEQSGQYKGQPLRTYSGGTFKNGYSDHLPTYIILEK